MAKAKESSAKENGTKLDGPQTLILEIKTPSGEVWGQVMAPAKEFKTGSLGYYANGKVLNPITGDRFQVGCNIILIGSKK